MNEEKTWEKEDQWWEFWKKRIDGVNGLVTKEHQMSWGRKKETADF